MTNSREMFRTLSKKCTPGSHRHVPLMEGRARDAAIYPRGLCRAILRGTIRQARVDKGNLASMACTGDGADVMAVEFEPDQWTQYWDDVSGKALKRELVEEMATVTHEGVDQG